MQQSFNEVSNQQTLTWLFFALCSPGYCNLLPGFWTSHKGNLACILLLRWCLCGGMRAWASYTTILLTSLFPLCFWKILSLRIEFWFDIDFPSAIYGCYSIFTWSAYFLTEVCYNSYLCSSVSWFLSLLSTFKIFSFFCFQKFA